MNKYNYEQFLKREFLKYKHAHLEKLRQQKNITTSVDLREYGYSGEIFNVLEPVKVFHEWGRHINERLYFLHIPKTGTTFAATLLHYCCAGLNRTNIDILEGDISMKKNSVLRISWKNKSCFPCLVITPRYLQLML